MTTALLPPWLKRKASLCRQIRRRTNQPGRERSRLVLEALEARCLLSTVTNLTDHDPGSLRDAIALTPPGGTVDFEPGLTGTIILTTGELMIAKNLSISGPGAGAITVSGNHASRVFNIASTFTVGIAGLAIAYGTAISIGGGILNQGSLTVTNSTLSANSAGASGGGIGNFGTLAVISSTLSGNSGGYAAGAGIYNNAGTATVADSTFSGNILGAISNNIGMLTVTSCTFSGNTDRDILNGGMLTVTSCTFRDNSADGAGAIYNAHLMTLTGSTISSNTGPTAIFNEGTLTVTDSTISGNSAPYYGAIWNFNTGTLTIAGSIISANSGVGIDNCGMLTVLSSVISGNSGGGILSYARSATATITNSSLTGNSSLSGGGIANGSAMTITNSTLSGNSTTGLDYGTGGGIRNDGTLTINNSTLSANSAHDGGGIYNDYTGTLTINNSTLSGNSATFAGGAIGNFNQVIGRLTINNSTLSANSAHDGGGIYNEVYGTLTINNSTLSGNSATNRGGAILNIGTVTITSSTLSGNFGLDGGGIFRSTGTVTTKNIILAGNLAPSSPDIAGLLNSQGHNLIGDGTGGSGFADTDLVGTAAFPIDPQLEPLGDYGGPTQTMRPLRGSPVINLGDNTDTPLTDQRGFPRVVLGFIDIGAVELQPDEFGGPGSFVARHSTSPAAAIVAALTRPVLSTVSAPATDTAPTPRPDRDETPTARHRLDAFFGLLGGRQGQSIVSQLGLYHLHRSASQPTGAPGLLWTPDGDQTRLLVRSLLL